ncbi:MAG TPA: DMT family transporter [Arenicellales bacterium]|nr:DMT family transporter [Arenicellales bacterium]
MSINAHQAAQPQPSGRAYLLLTTTTLCWGANAVFGRLAVGEISPMLLVSLRWLGAVLLMLAFASQHVRRDWPTLRRHLPFLALMGAVGFTAFNALFYVAAHATTAVNIGIIQGSIPVFVLIGAFIAYRLPVTGLQLAGVALTMIGVVIVGSGGSLERLAALALNHGDLLMVIACTLYASYAVGLRRRPSVSSLGMFTVLAGSAFVFSVPLTAAEMMLGRLQWPTPTGWLIAGAVTLLPSFLAQIFFIQGVAMIGPARAGVFINLVPVFASIMAVAFLGEPFEHFHALALGLVLAGIWLSERSGRR